MQATHDLKVQLRGISAEAMRTLVSYDFPGNIRELKNLVERACILSAGDELTPECFPMATQSRTAICASADSASGLTPDEQPLMCAFDARLGGHIMGHSGRKRLVDGDRVASDDPRLKEK